MENKIKQAYSGYLFQDVDKPKPVESGLLGRLDKQDKVEVRKYIRGEIMHDLNRFCVSAIATASLPAERRGTEEVAISTSLESNIGATHLYRAKAEFPAKVTEDRVTMVAYSESNPCVVQQDEAKEFNPTEYHDNFVERIRANLARYTIFDVRREGTSIFLKRHK